MTVTLIFHLIIFCIRCHNLPSLKDCNWEGIINVSFIDSFRPPRHFFLHFFVSVCNCDRVANKYKCKYFSSSSKILDKCGCVVDYNSIPTGWCQYLRLGYIVLCTSVNKTIIIIIITIIIIIIIIIIIVMKSGAPLLGLAKSFYYILVYSNKNLLGKGCLVFNICKLPYIDCYFNFPSDNILYPLP